MFINKKITFLIVSTLMYISSCTPNLKISPKPWQELPNSEAAPPQPVLPSSPAFAEVKHFLADWLLAQLNRDFDLYEEKYSFSFDGLLARYTDSKSKQPLFLHYDYIDWLQENSKSFTEQIDSNRVIRISAEPAVLQAENGDYYVSFSEVRCVSGSKKRSLKHLELRREEDGNLRIFHERESKVKQVQDCQQAVAEMMGIERAQVASNPPTDGGQYQSVINAVNNSISPESIADLQLSMDISPNTLGVYDAISAGAVEQEFADEHAPSTMRGMPTERLFHKHGVLLVPKIQQLAQVPSAVWKHLVKIIRLRRQIDQRTSDFDGINASLYIAFDCERHEEKIVRPAIVEKIRNSAMQFIQTGEHTYAWTTELYDKNGNKIRNRSSEFERKAEEFAKMMNSIGISVDSDGTMSLRLQTPIPFRSSADSVRQLQIIYQSLVAKLNEEKNSDPAGYYDISVDDLKFDKLAYFSHGMPYGFTADAKNRNESKQISSYSSGQKEWIGCGTSFRDSVHVNSHEDGLYGNESIDGFAKDGKRPSNLVSFARRLAAIVVQKVDILLYACNTSRDQEKDYSKYTGTYSNLPRFLMRLAPAIVGRNSFANLLTKTLRRFGRKDSSVYGHLTPKHVTLNKDGTMSGFDACLYKLVPTGARKALRDGTLPIRPEVASECLINGGVHIFYALYDQGFTHQRTEELQKMYEADLSARLQRVGIKRSAIKEMAASLSKAATDPKKLSDSLRAQLWQHFSQCVLDDDNRKTCRGVDMGLLMFARLVAAKQKIEKEFKQWFDTNKQRETLDPAIDKALLEKHITNALQNGHSS